MMDENPVKALITEIRQKFPEVSEKIDERLWSKSLGPEEETIDELEDELPTEPFEAFADVTTSAIRRQNENKLRNYLNYVSRRLNTATPIEKEYLDVYYVENLMYGIRDQKVKRWGWQQMPDNLRQLYRRIWDEL